MPEVRYEEGGTIIGFSGKSEGNALMELTKSLLRPLESLASRVAIIDVNRDDVQSQLVALLDEPVWFTVSYFGAGQDASMNSGGTTKNLWEASGIPFVRLFGDLPAYAPSRHAARYRNSINAYGLSSHLAFYRRWFSDPALLVQLPPMILDPAPLDQIDLERKARGKVVFPKNGNSPASLILYWRTAMPREISKALECLAEESVGNEWIDREPRLDDRLIAYFDAMGLDVATEPAVLCFLVAQLDDYIRRVKSTMITEALLDLPVVIRGRAWEHVDFRGHKATYDADSSIAKTSRLMDDTLAVIDMSPNTQDGPHDRICRAAGSGTAFLTNRQEFLYSLLSDADRFMFRFEPEEIRRCIEHYLERPREAAELGLEQSRTLRQAFSEEPFVERLLTAVHLCRLKFSDRPAGTQNFVAFPSAR